VVRKLIRAIRTAAFVVAAFASVCFGQHDPGVRGGAPSAGNFVPGLTTNQIDMFDQGKFRVTKLEATCDGCSDILPGSPTGQDPLLQTITNSAGLDARFNADQCSACHSQPASIEEKSVTVDALLAHTNAGTLDEAIHGLERRRKIHVMGGADPLIRLIRGAWDLRRGRSVSGELAMFATWDELKAAANGEKNGSPGDPALRVLVRLI
jgi:hypothetical protein